MSVFQYQKFMVERQNLESRNLEALECQEQNSSKQNLWQSNLVWSLRNRNSVKSLIFLGGYVSQNGTFISKRIIVFEKFKNFNPVEKRN